MMFDSELSVRNSEPIGKGVTAEVFPTVLPQRTAGQPLVHIRDLSRVYATEAGDFAALCNVTLELRQGEFVAIVGKSGSGKSTLLNMLSGIDRPTSGSVHVAGQDLSAMSESDLARWRGLNVGFVFQFHQLMPTLTISENVIMPMDFAGKIPKNLRANRSVELLDRVGIADQAGKYPAELSGGQQQRAAIARSLANQPPLVAADEPTGNLDSHSADSVLGLFRELTAEGTTVVMVTHERGIAATVDRVIAVADGRVEGTVVEGAVVEGTGTGSAVADDANHVG